MKWLVCLFPSLLCWSAPIGLYSPPEGWQPKSIPSRIQVGFIGKSASAFCPSINLITETIDCDLKEYLQAVKKIHLSHPSTEWRDLGSLEMKGGSGRLTEIRSASPWGNLITFQAILVKEQTAYILTAALLKNELASHQKTILSALRSLQVVEDLWSILPNEESREQFASFFQGTKQVQWQTFQDLIEKKTSSMGSYWQFLALKEGYAKIHQN